MMTITRTTYDPVTNALVREEIEASEFYIAATEIHPAPAEYAEYEITAEPILRFFHYAHLPERLKAVSKEFFELSRFVVYNLPRGAERTTALRKLLEAKDCAVRSCLDL